MINEFTKRASGERISLEEAFKAAAEQFSSEDFSQAMGELVADMLKAAHIKELDGYYPHRIVTCERSYYPLAGTLRLLPTGQILFAIASYESEATVYVTLENDAVEAIEWHKADESEALTNETRIPYAA